MGVYIPNMEKPKSCFDCFAYNGAFMECRATGECVNETFYDKVRDDCPLIEIDLERDIPTIWYNRQTGQYEPKDTKQEVYERLYKLKNRERRTDDKTEESRP